MKSKYSFADYGFQFITITAGVLIALLINGLVEWNRNQQLVQTARATILREIANNKTDLEATQSSFASDQEAMLNALTFADDLLAKRKISTATVNLHLNLADQISDAGWRTAERTGALSHMDYAEVQKYSALYSFQDLLMQTQRQALAQLTLTLSLFEGGFDPAHPNLKDLEAFRARVLDLKATLTMHEKFAKKMAEHYEAALEQ
jgi:hypothetical protein